MGASRRIARQAGWWFGLWLAVLAGLSPARADEVTIFAAASTTTAITAIAERFEAESGHRVRAVFAASSTLAKQILKGAPAEIFLSASQVWMDTLSARGAIDPDSRTDLLGNTLVLIAPTTSDLTLTIAPGFDLAASLDDRRLILGDPAHVPAGIYAKKALENLGVWESVASKTAYTGDVRAALALVGRGGVAAGIVYGTDARITGRVRVVDRFPTASHPAIVYPLAVVAGDRREAVTAFYDFLRGPAAGAIFAAQGFTLPATGE